MVELIRHVCHPDLCGKIVEQFAFMKAMSRPDDSNFSELQKLSLDDIYNKADNFFINFTFLEEIIDSNNCNLSEKITIFLSEWKSVADVTAIQQNIHHQLKVLDEN